MQDLRYSGNRKEQRQEIEALIEKAEQTSSLSSGQKWDAAVVFAKIGTGIVAVLGIAGYFLITSTAQVAATTAAQRMNSADATNKLSGGPPNSSKRCNPASTLSPKAVWSLSPLPKAAHPDGPSTRRLGAVWSWV
jgi:hypothetical protein